MIFSIQLVALALFPLSVSLSFAKQESKQAELSETIVIDEEPEAFFEFATSTLAAKMKAALRKSCAAKSSDSVFCEDNKVRFLRPVTVYGNKMQYGFACLRNQLYSRNKYFLPDDIRTRNSCIWIDCGYDIGICEVDLARLTARNDD